MLKDLEIKKVFGSQFVSLWYRTNRFHVAVKDQRRRQNAVRTSVTHSAIALCAIFCSYRILTSSVIYYWTYAQKHGIFLLNAPQFSKLRALWKRFEGCLSQQPPFGANLCSDICPWTYLQFSCSLDSFIHIVHRNSANWQQKLRLFFMKCLVRSYFDLERVSCWSDENVCTRMKVFILKEEGIPLFHSHKHHLYPM